jgi:MarR family 2-MHQ and catechol resistance regulon transcriptional repressor
MHTTREVSLVIRQWMEASAMRSLTDWRRFVRSAGLSMPQLSLLMRLYYGGGCGVHDIGKGFGVSSAAVSQMVDRLVQARLVARVESPEDRRVRHVELSAKGRELIDKGIRERYRWVDDLVDELPADQRASVLRFLPSLIEAEKRIPAAIPDRGERH